MVEEADLEQRFLDFVFTTEATITVGALAYFAKCSLQQAEGLLDRLSSDGTLRIESTESGDIFYVYPNRGRLERSRALISGQRAIVPAPGSGGPLVATTQAQDMGGPPLMVIGGGPSAPAPIPARPVGDALVLGNQTCPFCGESILAVAKKCKHCGEMLDPTLRAAQVDRIQVNVGMQHVQPQHPDVVPYNPNARHVSPGVAAVLSFVWPGAGHLYANKIGTGLAWMAGTFIGYIALIVPGLILHALCIFAAAGTARAENRRTGAL